MAEMMETDDNQCQLCLEEGRRGLFLKDLIAAENLEGRPPAFPQNIWRDRSWWVMCFICFMDLLKNGAPSSPEGDEEEDFDWEFDWDEEFDWDFDPLSNAEEDVFWGDFRQQRLTEYLEELGQMISEEPYNIDDLEWLRDEFWENGEFWSEVQEQWSDEFDELIRAFPFPPTTDDVPNMAELLHDLQNLSG